MNMVSVGIDLAKNIFDLHGTVQSGKAEFIKPKGFAVNPRKCSPTYRLA